MLDIIELQHQLNQNKEEAKGNENIFISRTARRNNDIDMLLKRGSTPCQVSEILGIPIGLVQPRVAELEREEAKKNVYLRSLRMPETGGYVGIFR